jgi:hypothetical protein
VTGGEGQRVWTIWECPACGSVRLLSRPADWNTWCDGACFHEKAQRVPVEVVPLARLRDVEKALRDACEAMDEVALSWRGDWSDFDGRMLLHQVRSITQPALAVLPPGPPDGRQEER